MGDLTFIGATFELMPGFGVTNFVEPSASSGLFSLAAVGFWVYEANL